MGAAAGIIGGIASGLSQSGQKDNTNASPQVSQGGNVSNAGIGSPQIAQADVKEAATNTPTTGQQPTTVEAKKEESSNGTSWKELADMARSLMSSEGQSPNMTYNSTASSQPIANFR